MKFENPEAVVAFYTQMQFEEGVWRRAVDLILSRIDSDMQFESTARSYILKIAKKSGDARRFVANIEKLNCALESLSVAMQSKRATTLDATSEESFIKSEVALIKNTRRACIEYSNRKKGKRIFLNTIKQIIGRL